MKMHCNRFAPVLGAVLVLLAIAAPARASESAVCSRVGAVERGWYEMLVFLLETLHEGIGGDPVKLQEEPTLSGKLEIVAGQYGAYGVPDDLSPLARITLIEAVDQIYGMLSAPPPESPISRPDAFLKVLRLMWEDLGMPPEELGMASL